MPWKAMLVCNSIPDDITRFSGLEYVSGPENYIDIQDYMESYHPDVKPISEGIVGYFERRLANQIRHSLNFFTPGCEEGWRWQTFDFDMDLNFHQRQFNDSLEMGMVAIYDEKGKIHGYLLGSVKSPLTYVVLAVLNAGPAPGFNGN